MSSLEVPNGLAVAPIKSENLSPEQSHFEYLEYLLFTARKLNQITQEVFMSILKAVGEGRKVNLIVPLNGGLIFYRKLMALFEQNLLYANALNVIFCDEDKFDQQDKSAPLCLSANPVDVENAYNLVIDDIWDKGGTGSEIMEALKLYGNIETLEYFAFCRKESSPENNNGAQIANPESIAVFPDEWLHGWGGMNSGKFESGYMDNEITALERTSFLPLIPAAGEEKFDTHDQYSVEQYAELLFTTNLAKHGVLPWEVYDDVLFLEQNPDLRTRFNYLLNIHQKFLRFDADDSSDNQTVEEI